jgi:hypothetical protein
MVFIVERDNEETILSDMELEVVAGGCVWGYNCGR